MTNLADFTLTTIDGNAQSLADFRGKVVLFVNVASRCGFTPQYAELEKLHEEYADKGLVIAGVPSNDFGAQEPGSETEIKAFCETTYGVKFPLFAKLTVKGEGKHALYEWLTSSSAEKGEVKWNFEKFLVGKDGNVVARFGSSTKPLSPELKRTVDEALSV